MSNTRNARNVAFARTPRNQGNTANSTPNEGSGRKPIRIDAAYLAKLKAAKPVDDLSTVMTNLGGSLRLDILPTGGMQATIVDDRGGVLADEADIQRIQTLSASISKERKDALKEDSVIQNQRILAAMSTLGDQVQRPVNRFPDNFLDVFRPISAQMVTLSKNTTATEALTVTDAGKVLAKQMVMEFSNRIRIAVGEFLFHKAQLPEGEVALKLNHFMRVNNVPTYVFHRLCDSVLQMNQSNFDIVTVFFPQDPTKGLYLTFREIMDTDIIHQMGGLLGNADIMLALFEHGQRVIRSLINIPQTTDLENFDEANSFASKIAGTPFYVPPPVSMVTPEQIFNFLIRNGLRGLQWQSGTTFTPQDNLKFVGTVAKRLHYGLLPRPQGKAPVYTRMFPGFEYIVGHEDNIFSQLRSWFQTPGRDLTWFRSGDHANWPARFGLTVAHAFAAVLAVPDTDSIVVEFVDNFGHEDFVHCGIGENNASRDLYVDVKNLVAQFSEQGIPSATLIQMIAGRYRGSGLQAPQQNVRAKGAQPGVTERSVLASGTRRLLADIRQTGRVALANRLDHWFRLFSRTETQLAVANLFAARLEAFLAAPIEVDRAERLAFMDPDAYADPESEGSEDGRQNDDDRRAPPENPDGAI